MKNNLFSKFSKSYPVLFLAALTITQIFYARWSLEEYRNYSDQDQEILYERMSRDKVPSDIKQHIIYVQNQATSNTSRLVNSVTSNQILLQLGMLLVLYNFCSRKNRQCEDADNRNNEKDLGTGF